MNRSTIIGVFALIAAAETRAQVASDRAPAAIAGCYKLTLGNWSRPLGVNAAYHRLPEQFQLDTAPAERQGWKIIPDIPYPHPHRYRAPRWTTKGDSVEMLWSDGFQPTWIRTVRQSNGELVGEAEVGSDTNEFGKNLPRARAVAHRIACPISK